jgi:hypothetical protein
VKAVLDIFMFSSKQSDRYCLRSKFEALNMYDFRNWDDLYLVSLKITPSAGGTETDSPSATAIASPAEKPDNQDLTQD